MPSPSTATAIPLTPVEFPFSQEFPTPLEVLCFYDDDIRTGKVKVHKWQKETLTELGRKRVATEDVVQAILVAANGSGKSQFILAPFVVWAALTHLEALTVVTTASGEQLNSQALRYITRLAQRANQVHRDQLGFDLFECQYRKFTNNLTKSFIDLFATDEAGKAEGRHPLKHDGEFVIVVDEAKTVDDSIFAALERCTGFTRRLDISSPGDCSGYFYNNWGRIELPVWRKQVTAFDCPHISQKSIQERILKYGPNDPLIRSSIFAEFVSTQEQVVIPRELLSKNNRLCDEYQKTFGNLVAGLDLSHGGDETVLSVWYGNIELGCHTCRNTDSTITADEISSWFASYKGKLKQENVYADDGGVGASILDMLAKRGLKFTRILNQHRAFDSIRYANRGTELWFNFKRFIEEFQVCFLRNSKEEIDPILATQLTNRYYRTQAGTGKIILESKAEARRKGHQSPDRADAAMLAWCGRVFPLAELTGTKVAKQPVESPAQLHERLSQQIRAKLRKEQIEGQVGGSSSSNINSDGTYKRTGSFSFALDNIIPRANKYGKHFTSR